MTQKKKEEGACKALGRHLLADFCGVSRARLADPNALTEWVREAVIAARATLIELRCHSFSPQGLTLFALLKESHLAVHTWPEKDYVAVDIFTCGDADPQAALESLERRFQPEFVSVREVPRGEL
jgi:S-adenosylmethionine decarboxylase